MGKSDVQVALRLMQRAWTSRWETMESPPESNRELQEKVQGVRRDLVEAVAICRKAGAGRELVDALRKLGHVEQDMGREDETRALYEEAVAVSRNLGDALLLAHSVRHLGDIHRSAGRFEAAEASYSEALALYRDHGRGGKLDLANAIRPLAILREDAGMVEQAIALWGEAGDLYAEVGVKEGVEECSSHLRRLSTE